MKKHRILLADNDPALTDVYARILRTNGYEVRTALSPAEARGIAVRETIDLAIMGLRLEDDSDPNDRSGLTLAEEIQPKIPTILFSNYTDHEMVRRAHELKFDIVPKLDKSEGAERLLETLRETLSHLEKEREDEDGKPKEDEAIGFAFFDGMIRVVSLTTDGEYTFLDEAENLHKILYVTSSETLALQSVVDELESLVNSPNAREQDFQDFFERHPDFIISDEYKKAHPHIVLTNDGGETLIPDFVLEPLGENSLSDLLELKLPSAPVFILKKSRMRFSAAVFEACAQLREYSAFFDEERNRRVVQERYGILAYRPKMIVIIGRQGPVDPIAVRRIEQDLPNLHLRTYDDVINRMKTKVDAMKRGRIR
jgi:CheY-like chemotaxis protein